MADPPHLVGRDLLETLPELIDRPPSGTRVVVLPEGRAQVAASVGGRFILAADGRATALTGPHGQSYTAV